LISAVSEPHSQLPFLLYMNVMKLKQISRFSLICVK